MDEWTQDAIDLYWDQVRSEFDASKVAESDDEEYWSDKNVRIRVRDFALQLTDIVRLRLGSPYSDKLLNVSTIRSTHSGGCMVHMRWVL